jgi:hypothetical protein
MLRLRALWRVRSPRCRSIATLRLHSTTTFDNLLHLIERRIQMSHVYQPVLIRSLLERLPQAEISEIRDLHNYRSGENRKQGAPRGPERILVPLGIDFGAAPVQLENTAQLRTKSRTSETRAATLRRKYFIAGSLPRGRTQSRTVHAPLGGPFPYSVECRSILRRPLLTIGIRIPLAAYLSSRTGPASMRLSLSHHRLGPRIRHRFHRRMRCLW